MKACRFSFSGDYGYELSKEQQQRLLDCENDKDAADSAFSILECEGGYTKRFRGGLEFMSRNSYLMFTVYF